MVHDEQVEVTEDKMEFIKTIFAESEHPQAEQQIYTSRPSARRTTIFRE